VFHEDVPPMGEDEVETAFQECYGRSPNELYMDFDTARPVKSGSIGSVYVAKKPFLEDGREVLRPVVIKVGRHNIDREFAIGKLVLGLAIMSSQYWAPHSKLTPFLRAMQEQVDEFVAGFMEELDFEKEAQNHARFYDRSLRSGLWKVPQLYGHTHRIIEMEYLADATSLTRALRRMNRRDRRRFQARLAERLLYAVLYHGLVYGEIHGDLHPGNVMVGSDGALHLIDWGNVVKLDGKWAAVWDYLAAAVLADTALLTDTLIEMSTHPEENRARRSEIKASLDETLDAQASHAADQAQLHHRTAARRPRRPVSPRSDRFAIDDEYAAGGAGFTPRLSASVARVVRGGWQFQQPVRKRIEEIAGARSGDVAGADAAAREPGLADVRNARPRANGGRQPADAAIHSLAIDAAAAIADAGAGADAHAASRRSRAAGRRCAGTRSAAAETACEAEEKNGAEKNQQSQSNANPQRDFPPT
jgi:hypothetical protein